MTNRPFTAENINIYNDTLYTSAPSTLGTNNVIFTRALNRSICDQNATMITDHPQPVMSGSCHHCCCSKFQPPQIQTAYIPQQEEYIPGGVSLTFNPLAQNYALHNFSAIKPQPTPQGYYQNQFGFNQPQCNSSYYLQPQHNSSYYHQPQHNSSCCHQLQQIQQARQQPLTLEQQIALKQMEREGLEMLLIQEQLKKNPYKLRFHYNGQTSTTDLLQTSLIPPSHRIPDFEHLTAGMSHLKKQIEEIGRTDNKLTPGCPPTALYPPVSKAKRLILTKSPDIHPQSSPETNTQDPCCSTSLETNGSQQNPNLPETEPPQQPEGKMDQSVQTKAVQCKKNSAKGKRKRKSKKTRKEESEELSSSSSSSCSCHCNDD